MPAPYFRVKDSIGVIIPSIPGIAFLMRRLDPLPLVESGFKSAIAEPSTMTEAVLDRSVGVIRREGLRDALRERRQKRHAALTAPAERLGVGAPGIANDIVLLTLDETDDRIQTKLTFAPKGVPL